ncbi:MAG: S9 family peptidase [Planctomycetota bacterium]
MQDTPPPRAPVAKKVPHEISWHGDVRIDDYFWMRERSSPEVVAHLEAENAYAEAVLAPTEALQERIYEEIVGRIQESDLDVPVRRGDFFYYSRTETGAQYRIYCRRPGAEDAPEQVYLDLNEFADTHPFVGLGDLEVDDSGTQLAFSLDTQGFRQYQLQFRDLTSGARVGFTAPRVTSVAWAADGQTVFFTQEDEVTKRSHRLYRQRLDETEPTLILQEDDERFRLGVRRTRSKRFLLVTSSSHTTSEVRFLPTDAPLDDLRLVAPREQDHEYYVDHQGDRFLIRTNDTGRNFRLAAAPVAAPGREQWATLQEHSDTVMLTGVAAFAQYYVVAEREDGLPQMRVTMADGSAHRVEVPEAAYTLRLGANPEFDPPALRYQYESLITPSSIYDYDPVARRAELRKRTEVLGDYDPANYVVERQWAPTRDGTRVPVSLVYRQGLVKDGDRPVFLVGYGSYGFAYPVSFSHARVSLLDRGVVCAIAHIRGGGELGKAWHDAGRMNHKMNSFYDFIDVAQHLVDTSWTRPAKLTVQGGSAGGLLMGAVANLRPDVFGSVIADVPFVDVLTTMLDEDLPLTVGEFEEWGNPKVADEYRYMRRYCPYSNLEAQAYPAMLVKTSFHDSQVMYWEPAKYVAKLRTLKTNDEPLLFVVNMKGGHGGSSGRYDRFREVAQDYAFALTRMGIDE